jgi:dTDP-4-dehydrorhamnose 3,5-epimerase-like enzyme
VSIAWPSDLRLEISRRDQDAPLLRDIKDALPF